ncbi:MAG: LysM peptidoglycan-binding domain-containing protein [Deltaproteobacteria bacterium]|nr:LysM peptidoglycan-binding domain-containing protein [Deltaproteobacteria bacterium]
MANSNEGVKEKEQEKERDIMEEALLFIDESRTYWEKGDLEKALDMLDQAYALILDTDGHPDIARQQDDLRLLISKRILAIYTSMHTATKGMRSEIPYVLNADVEKEIRLFQTVERDFFIQSYKRSGLFRPIILRELKKAGLPEELSWLPLVESGFKTYALSKARALGLWQFIPSTGYKYGLNRDEWVDERLNVEKSTRAAIDYLRDLHGMFGDWLTVLAAYNCGEGRVLKVISRQHINYLDRFWDLYHQLPHETARYVPRFMATLLIIKDPKKYHMDLEEFLDQPYSYELVKTTKSMRLQDIAPRIGTSEDKLNTLNSELRQRITPDKEYNLKVPKETVEKFVKVVDEIPQWEKPRQAFIKHRAKRGETVVSIARKYGTSVGAIMSYNNLSGKKRMKVGQRLIIPVEGHSYAKVKSNNLTDVSKTQINEEIIKYRVKKGDTLATIAKRYDTSVHEIRKVNKLKSKTLKPGQIIMISTGNGGNGNEKQSVKEQAKSSRIKTNKGKSDHSVSAESKTYTVKKGDSLAKIAKGKRISLNKLLEMNKLSREDGIKPGQVINIQ